jgi:hypothetical protein
MVVDLKKIKFLCKFKVKAGRMNCKELLFCFWIKEAIYIRHLMLSAIYISLLCAELLKIIPFSL